MSSRPVLSADLRRLRRAARQLLQACHAADPGALSRLHTHHPRHRDAAPSAAAARTLRLADAQLVIARELGHPSWPRLRLALRVAERHGIAPLDAARAGAELHIRCGSDIREALRLAGLGGDFLEIADPVCQGPVVAGDPARLSAVRARWMYDTWALDDAAFLAERLSLESDSLAGLDDYRRLVLWFEHDSYDQIILIRLLAGLARRDFPRDRVHLIQVDRYPGVERFIGLGQLSPAQLADLYPRAMPLGDAGWWLAVAAWDAYRQPTPHRLQRLLAGDTDGLPFLAPAIRRLWRELPWVGDGLGLSERLTLQALAGGPRTPGQVFGELMRRLDPLPYLGDLMYWPVVRTLAGAGCPALTPFTGIREPLALTPFGQVLLAGEVDWVAVNGAAERWVGGLYVRGRTPRWRWCEDDRAVVAGA